jgi:acyl transferase domain-containing protein
VCSGGIEYEDAFRFVVARAAALAADPSNPGAMVAVAATEDVVQRYINELGIQDRVVIAVANGKESHVVSGSAPAVQEMYATVKKNGLRAAVLKVDQGMH